MGNQTYLRYGAVRIADSLDDQKTASAITTSESTSITQEDLQEFELSQIKRIIFGDQAGHWYDDFNNAGGDNIYSLYQLTQNSNVVTNKMFLRRLQVLTHITVPNGQNWKILSVAGSELPAGENIALMTTTQGLVAAQLGGGQIGSNQLTLVAGNPTKNMVGVRIANTNDDLIEPATAATLTIPGADGNGGVTYTAGQTGQNGNNIQVRHVQSGNNTALSVSATGNQITVNLATDGGGAITSTATQVAAAVNSFFGTEPKMVTAAATGTGASTAGAQAYTNLAGGQEEILVFALLQAESTAVDGGAPNDTVGGNRLQVSFVHRNPISDAIEASPVSTTQNKVLELLYPDRILFTAMPEESNMGLVPFVDEVPQTAVTLMNAYLGGQVVNIQASPGPEIHNLAEDLTSFKVQQGGNNFFTLSRNDTTGDEARYDTDKFNVHNTQTANFDKGVSVDTLDTSIDIGVSGAGVISRSTFLSVTALAGHLTLTATGASSDVKLIGGRDISFQDSRFSTTPFSDASTGTEGGAAWTTRLNNPPSVVAAINRAAGLGGKDFRYGNYFRSGGTITAGNNVPGGSFFDFTTEAEEETLVFYDGVTPSNQNCFVAFNGRRLATGDNSSHNDVRLGTTPANGDLIFTFPIRNNDFVEAWAHISKAGTP